MAISMLDNISYRGKKADNERSLFSTIAEMVAYNENYLPNIYTTWNEEDGCQYKYQRSNPVDPETGRWRKMTGGEGGADLVNYYNKAEVNTLLEDKVDVEVGKGLSTNDYDDTEKQKVEDLETLVGDSTLTTTADTVTGAVNELVSQDAALLVLINENAEEIEKLQKTPAIAVDAKPTYNAGEITYEQGGVEYTTEDTNQWFYYSDPLTDKLYQTIWINGQEKTIESGGVDFDDYCKKEDIITTLDSVATNKPLSASAGKALKDALDAGLDEKLSIEQDISKAGYVVKVGADGNLILSEDSGEGEASGISYSNEETPTWDNVKKALDGIISKIYYVAPKITSFTASPNTTVYEVGQTVSSISFAWAVNKTITSQSLTDCVVDEDDRTATYDTPFTTNKTFTLLVGDGQQTDSKSISIQFQNKAYWGSAASSDSYDSAFILGLSSNKFATSIKGEYSINVGSGEYGFLCVPDSFTRISSWYIGGFEVSLVDEGTISFTNASGGVVTYRIYRTTQPALGSIKIEVK